MPTVHIRISDLTDMVTFLFLIQQNILILFRQIASLGGKFTVLSVNILQNDDMLKQTGPF